MDRKFKHDDSGEMYQVDVTFNSLLVPVVAYLVVVIYQIKISKYKISENLTSSRPIHETSDTSNQHQFQQSTKERKTR